MCFGRCHVRMATSQLLTVIIKNLSLQSSPLIHCSKRLDPELANLDIGDAVWRKYLPAILAAGKFQAKLEPMILEGGLERFRMELTFSGKTYQQRRLSLRSIRRHERKSRIFPFDLSIFLRNRLNLGKPKSWNSMTTLDYLTRQCMSYCNLCNQSLDPTFDPTLGR